jgi:hypothetical protein
MYVLNYQLNLGFSQGNRNFKPKEEVGVPIKVEIGLEVVVVPVLIIGSRVVIAPDRGYG